MAMPYMVIKNIKNEHIKNKDIKDKNIKNKNQEQEIEKRFSLA